MAILGSVRQCCQGEVKLMWQQADTVNLWWYIEFSWLYNDPWGQKGATIWGGEVQFKKKNNIGTSY